MKPCNFPGRRRLRRERAALRAAGDWRGTGNAGARGRGVPGPMYDMRFRVGAAARGPDGWPRKDAP